MNKIILLFMLSLASIQLTGCIGYFIPTNCCRDTSPYYISTTTIQVRGITVPPQSKLRYKAQHFFQKDQQTQPLNEKDLADIQLPPDTAIIWGGMPSYMFIQFLNSEMKGFSVYPVDRFSPQSTNEFIRLWQSCGSSLDVTLKNPHDWSFNPENMEIQGCGINIQKRGEYNKNWPNQDQADAFLIKINQALQKLPKQQRYPMVHAPIEK